jgi:hypothetical protein
MSDKIRWSLDLRWQRPDKSVGFYDLKQGVLMRTKDDPNLQIDWDSFDNVDRAVEAKKQTCKKDELVSVKRRLTAVQS